MKALIVQEQEDIDNRTGIFSVATQFGHVGNDAWVWDGRIVTRYDIDGYYGSTRTVTHATLTPEED